MSNAQVIDDFDIIRKSLEHALTYPSKQIMGEIEYRKAHEELSKALYSLSRLERTVSKLDIGIETYIQGK